MEAEVVLTREKDEGVVSSRTREEDAKLATMPAAPVHGDEAVRGAREMRRAGRNMEAMRRCDWLGKAGKIEKINYSPGRQVDRRGLFRDSAFTGTIACGTFYTLPKIVHAGS